MYAKKSASLGITNRLFLSLVLTQQLFLTFKSYLLNRFVSCPWKRHFINCCMKTLLEFIFFTDIGCFKNPKMQKFPTSAQRFLKMAKFMFDRIERDVFFIILQVFQGFQDTKCEILTEHLCHGADMCKSLRAKIFITRILH